MTSNLGAREMSEMISGGIGFAPSAGKQQQADTNVDQKIYRTAVEAARRKFSPEFMNRIDSLVVFRSLNEEHLESILDLELQAVQKRISNVADTKFFFECSDAAREFLLKEGTDYRYGARHLKRAIERLIVHPFANLVTTERIGMNDSVHIDLDQSAAELSFTKVTSNAPQGEIEEPAKQFPAVPVVALSVNNFLGCI
jgi:ATP-dependent Clp protease ATP-binding subunit ClpB